MAITEDPNDPRLNRSSEGQNEAYLVLSEADRASGFVRPVRRAYIHVGIDGHEIDPNDWARHGRTGTACGVESHMAQAIAETYARQPDFYGSTYCVGCGEHFAVAEFVWSDTDQRVGS